MRAIGQSAPEGSAHQWHTVGTSGWGKKRKKKKNGCIDKDKDCAIKFVPKGSHVAS